MVAPSSLIINSAFTEPGQHWAENPDRTLRVESGRRPAGYEIIDTRENTRRTVSLPRVDGIRERVRHWREAGYQGVTEVTRDLLRHWRDEEGTSRRPYRFYFCQIEAAETLIWHVEAAPEFRQGVNIPGDGGPFERLCNKMATGTGKTTVMAMLIAWQVLNALAYPKRNKHYSRAVLVVAPGLTVKDRLRVLYPGDPTNYYDEFDLAPSESMRQRLNQMEILVENWHTLMPLREADRSVVKKGAESDEAYTRRVLGKLAQHKDLLVINDEAHHAWRAPADIKISRKDAEELGLDLEEATRWVEGLDRLHKTRRIQRCFDLSATPFAPTGRTNTEAGLFDWVITDFGLNDAIEAGLVKTPRVVVRDGVLPNAATLRPKLYHLYREPEVGQDLNRRGAQPHEPLPEFVQQAYTLLGADWRETARLWREEGHPNPPVLLTVCNRTETAARVEHYFSKGHAQWPELHAPDRTLRVDSRVLEKAEIGETAGSDKDYETRLQAIVAAADIPATRKQQLGVLKKEELLRALVDSVGKRGQAGQDLQNVISVAMLSEGWDAKNVTHIMGLRAFTSQLLCEQVIGRGLRRVSYDVKDDLFEPEYVNIFGVPLSIALQPGEGDGAAPPPPKKSTQIEALIERNEFEIRWPNILRVDSIVRPQLVLDWEKVGILKIDPAVVPIQVEIAPALGGAAAWNQVRSIDLEKLPDEFRLQRLVFRAAQKAFDQVVVRFKGQREYLLFQLVRLVEQFLESNKYIDIPSLFHQDPLRRRILLSLKIDAIVEHLLKHVYEQNTTKLEPVFDAERPIGSTREMRTWYTTRICEPTRRSQVSHLVVDSGWEKYVADILEAHPQVSAWAKNDHLGFQIYYLWNGSKRKFIPDFLMRYASGKTLVLEVKGEDSAQDQAKRAALRQWVEAVNAHGGLGSWAADVVLGEPAGARDVVDRYG
ncbi:MAG: DEAD/DEAH box helicase family protein [Betaproteobacteria bacterium]